MPIPTTFHPVHRLTPLAAAVLLVVGCGGSGGGPASPAGDTTPPTVAIDSSTPGATATGPVAFSFRFSEDVGSSFTAADVTLNVGTVTLFTRVSGTQALVEVTPPAQSAGTLQVGLVALGVSDASGNLNTQAAVTMQPFDTRAAPMGVPPGHVLAWADEFDIDGLPDPDRWDHDTERNLLGWYNNELQYYARDRPENARVSGGRLLITARKESLSARPDWGGQRYSSARLITRDRAQWTHGFIEVRAKLPCGLGTWPAIWMLGTRGTWPDDGEIDIMEQVGSNPTRIFGTLHTRESGGPGTGADTQIPDACTAFHDYQLTWLPGQIQIGVDNRVYYSASDPGRGYAGWPFDAPQYLLLNIAIGGNLGGPVDDAIFPVTMEVEHVRVYQRR